MNCGVYGLGMPQFFVFIRKVIIFERVFWKLLS